MNSWMSSCNSAHMANNLMRWWRSKFYKGYKPFTVDTAEPPVSDLEELLGRRSADYRISCTTPPLDSHLSANSLPIITDLHSTTHQALPHLNLQEFSCNVSVEEAPSQRLKDKQEFSFTLYDFDGHGKITKDDIAGLVTTIYEALGSSVKVPHCGSKTIKVKLTVSPDQRKHVSTSVVNNTTLLEDKSEQNVNFNVTIKHASNDKKKNNSKEHDAKKHYCCRKLNEEAEVVADASDDYSDVCSRISTEVTATEEDCDPAEEFNKCKSEQKSGQKPSVTKSQSAVNKKECDVKKHGKSFLHTKKVKKRQNTVNEEGIELQTSIDSNNASFYTPRKLNLDHANVENNQFSQEVKHHRHRLHKPSHSHNNTPLRCLANVDPTHFYVDLMALQNNTQISNGDCQYDKLMDAVMCVSNKKLSECCKRHNHFKSCDVPNTPFNCQLLENNVNSTKPANKPMKKQTKKQNDFDLPNTGKKYIRKFPRVVLGHTSSPHHLRHRNRQEDQARAMAQVVRWLEQEFSNNLYTNVGEERTKTTNCESNNKEHPCGMSKNQNYYTEYHEHHHVHEHIHHHYHHYQESSVV
ncbi:hypothetical protein RN001_015643 [Aquatica leii]|uniref:Protein naked cuticle homolog n=1 Tax=Aquatica leii TaxID=1421715 RepID=A0AAN7PM95_9COLE|nr:hypothetical protein RN001_015643 [Aquatica leii]